MYQGFIEQYVQLGLSITDRATPTFAETIAFVSRELSAADVTIDFFEGVEAFCEWLETSMAYEEADTESELCPGELLAIVYNALLAEQCGNSTSPTIKREVTQRTHRVTLCDDDFTALYHAENPDTGGALAENTIKDQVGSLLPEVVVKPLFQDHIYYTMDVSDDTELKHSLICSIITNQILRARAPVPSGQS